jgi:hypothetical protein
VEATQEVQDHSSSQNDSSRANSGQDKSGQILKIGSMSILLAQDHSGPILKIGSTSMPLATAEAQCLRGAAGFYWIAGLSLINMIALAERWDFNMVIGLGVTDILQAAATIAEKPGVKVGFYAATLAVIALFAIFGWRARQIERWPFVLGMWLYAADSVIFYFSQDFYAFGFHIFWLVFLWFGLIWIRPVQEARRLLASAGGPHGAPDAQKPGSPSAGEAAAEPMAASSTT